MKVELSSIELRLVIMSLRTISLAAENGKVRAEALKNTSKPEAEILRQAIIAMSVPLANRLEANFKERFPA